MYRETHFWLARKIGSVWRVAKQTRSKQEEGTELKSDKSEREKKRKPEPSSTAHPVQHESCVNELEEDGERSAWWERERCMEGADERQQLWEKCCCGGRAQHLGLSHWFQLNNKLDHFSRRPAAAPLAFLFIRPFSRAACATCVKSGEKKHLNTLTHSVWKIWMYKTWHKYTCIAF